MFKKMFFLAAVVALSAPAIEAQKLFTRDGKVYFNATVPASPEKIEASHAGGTFVLEQTSGKVEMAVLIKGFAFEKALMQEHFNENYMESSKFPKASFKGALDKLADVDFAKDGVYKTTVSGDFTMHGVTNKVSAPVTITIKKGAVSAAANFAVTLKDYGIEVPSLVADKVAKQATISIAVELKKM